MLESQTSDEIYKVVNDFHMRRGYVDNITEHPYSLDNESEEPDEDSHYEYMRHQHQQGYYQHMNNPLEQLDLGSEYYSDEGDDEYDSQEDRTIDLFLDGGDLIQHM